jgi:outer membrane murein-binding lipoprotein Lpp
MKQIVLFLLMSMASALMIRAGCVSDCKDEFDSAVQSCKLLHDDPEDADDLEQCIQSAKDDYQSCIEDCKN